MSVPLTCALIDDEPLARQALTQSLQQLAGLTIVGHFADAVQAFDALPALRPDLLFVDIHLPQLSGLALLRALPPPCPQVVLVTADPSHALDGFEVGAVDYLLKPVSMDRLLRAISRVRERLRPWSAADNPAPLPPPLPFLFVKTDKRLEQLDVEQIVFIEGLGDYVKIHLPQRFVVTHLTLTHLQATLPATQFLRISRSYIVGLFHLKLVDGHHLVLSTGHQLTVGPHYREQVRQQLRPWRIG